MMKYLILVAVLFGCSQIKKNPYESATKSESDAFKVVRIPLPSGTKYMIGYSPMRDGNRHYSWAFNVPYGTPVVAMEEGEVTLVRDSGTGGGCDEKYEGQGHLIRIRQPDGSIAQYLHLHPKVKVGDQVKKGQVIAETALNGMMCGPHLLILVYENQKEAEKGHDGKTIPMRFTGIPGLALAGFEGKVP